MSQVGGGLDSRYVGRLNTEKKKSHSTIQHNPRGEKPDIIVFAAVNSNYGYVLDLFYTCQFLNDPFILSGSRVFYLVSVYGPTSFDQNSCELNYSRWIVT